MPSSHICKPHADIASDYLDAIRAAGCVHQMDAAREQAVLELQCSWGFSRKLALAYLATLLLVWLIEFPQPEEIHEAAYAAPVADFV
jgi:hypothetical protein